MSTREEDARFAPDGMARLQGRINGLQRELDAAQRQLVDAREARSVELYLFAGLVYFVLCSIGTLASQRFEKKAVLGGLR